MSPEPAPGAKQAAPLLSDAAVLDAADELDRAEAGTERTFGGAPPAAPAAVVDWNAEAHDLVDFARGLFFPLYPRLASVWNDERRGALEKRLAPVLQKYNLNLEALLGKWGPEIMLAAVIVPAVVPTAQAIRADVADLEAAKTESSHAAPPAGKSEAPPPPAPIPAPAAAPPDTTNLHARL